MGGIREVFPQQNIMGYISLQKSPAEQSAGLNLFRLSSAVTCSCMRKSEGFEDIVSKILQLIKAA